MSMLVTWGYIIGALLIAVLANSVSAVWASKPNWMNPWLLAVVILGPLVFITFGLVASRVGVALGSASIDSLLTVTTVLVGLFVFQEWSKVNVYQYMGIGLVFLGIVLIQFTAKSGS